jgi:hypothetical protein
VSAYHLDPAAPCPYHPGSPEKIACLCLRRRRRLPLWHPGDAQGARRLEVSKLGGVSARTRLERCIFTVITWQEQPARLLAEKAGYQLNQHFYKGLWALADAGVLEQGRRGWRLANLQL